MQAHDVAIEEAKHFEKMKSGSVATVDATSSMKLLLKTDALAARGLEGHQASCRRGNEFQGPGCMQ